MKNLLLSVLIVLGLFGTAFCQKTSLKMVNDIGTTLSQDNPKNPPSKVIHIIFLKLEKKYKLVRPNQQHEAAKGELIAMRRKYTASREGNELALRAYDHALAAMLTLSQNPNQTNSASCDGARKELVRALRNYDSALKAYQRCLNPSNSSITSHVRTMDAYLGGGLGDENSATLSCNSHLKNLRNAISDIKRWSNLVQFACK